MKKNIFIFIIDIVLLIIIVLVVVFFINNIENLSNNELKKLSDSGDQFPNGFIDRKLDNYGGIINSSDSIEDAKNVVLEEFNHNDEYSKNEVIKNNIILQTDNCYGLDVSWLYTSSNGYSHTYSEKVISFKKSIYDDEKDIFNSKNKETIKEVLNLIYYKRQI